MKNVYLKIIGTLAIMLFVSAQLFSQNQDNRGIYFSKKKYDGGEIPIFNASKDKLPNPIMEDNTEWLNMYWKCWEIAFDHFKKPSEKSPFVSNILDEAYNEKIFQWDMIFMVMFARYGHHVFPAVNSLDNFYITQHPSGYICRSIFEEDGRDCTFRGRKNTINPPLFSWAEMESIRNTGDISRFEMVLPVLEKYVEWLNKEGNLINANDEENWFQYGRRASNSVHQLYWNTGLGSGMDNTPRGGNGWVDMSSQMVLQYDNLSKMCIALHLKDKAKYFKNEAKKITKRINKYCWNDKDGLYYDVDGVGNQVKWKTAGCFWPMLAGIASKKQCEKLVANLTDTTSFWRKNVFPTLAADQEGFNPLGGYWLGSVWAPTNYVIIKGLESNGYEELATKATAKYLSEMYCVFDSTQTVWENYSSDYSLPGNRSKPDFVGWTGIGPISLLIENILGFRLDAPNNTLKWIIKRTDEHGIENLRIGNTTIDAICKKRVNPEAPLEITFSSDKDIRLVIVHQNKENEYNLKSGEHVLKVK